MKIGVLGGSFNPAHEGHIHISNIALKEFKLDEIWWLVSPQNPLKTNFTKSATWTKKLVDENITFLSYN